MALLDDNQTIKAKPVPGQARSLSRPENPDWKGGQERGPVTKQDTNTGRFSRPTIDQDYAYQAFREKMLGPLGLGDNSPKTDTPTEDIYSEEQATKDTHQAIRKAQASARSQLRGNETNKRQLPKINLPGIDVKARMTVTRITTMNASWIGFTWLFVQLPLALLSLAGFAVVAGLDSILNSDKTSEYSGVFDWLVAKTVSITSAAINSIAEFVGFDFAEIAFSIGAGLHMVILALGWLSILIVYVQYIFAGLRPASGQGGGIKSGMLLLAIICYAAPMLNAFPFPFIALWMAAVWYYPK